MKPSAVAREIANDVLAVYARRAANATPSVTFIRRQPRIVMAFAAKILRDRGFKAAAHTSGAGVVALHVRICS